MLITSNKRIITNLLNMQSSRTIFATNICYSSTGGIPGGGGKPGTSGGKKSKKGGFWGKLADKSGSNRRQDGGSKPKPRSSPNRKDTKNKSQSNANMKKYAGNYQANLANKGNNSGVDSEKVYNSHRTRDTGAQNSVVDRSGSVEDNFDSESTGRRGKGRRRPSGEVKDDDDYSRLDNRIEGSSAPIMDPVDAATLEMLNLSKFSSSIKEGLTLDPTNMDQFDIDTAHIMIEGLKSPDDTFKEALETKSKRDYSWNNLPEARSSYQLMKELQPKIDPSIERGSIAHQLGCEAWATLSGNYYFTDKQKAFMSNEISRIAQNAINVPEEKEYDMTYYPSFRPGAEYLEQQKLMQKDEVENIYQQEETDWNQTAVFDEDEL